MIDLSIIIVNWNAIDVLINCINSIYKFNKRISLEVIVVDNNSSDNSVEILRNNFISIIIIENKINYGFSKANNQGIKISKGKYICLLNPDTKFVDNSFDLTIEFLDRNSNIIAIGPKILNADEKTIQYWGARNLPNPLDTFFEYSKLSYIFPKSKLFSKYLIGNWDHNSSRYVKCLSGACMVFRRIAVDEIGLLDEEYPLYIEDTDWFFRVSKTNWKVYYWSDAKVIHYGQHSSSKVRGESLVKTVKGIYRYYYKTSGFLGNLQIWFFIFIISLLKILAWAIVLLFSVEKNGSSKMLVAYFKILFLIPAYFQINND